MTGYCTYCQNTGTVDCECGGDLCLCGAGEMDCPVCRGDFVEEQDDCAVCGEDHEGVVPTSCKTGDGE